MRRSRLFESEEHDAGLAVTDTGKIEVFDLIADSAKNLVRRIGGGGENDRTPHTVATSALGEDLRVDVAPGGKKPVSAKFGGSLCGKRSEGFRESLLGCGRLSE